MKKINFVKAFFISIFKPGEYYNLIKESLVRAFVYMISITVITGLISFTTPARDYLDFINLIEDEVGNGFPEFTLYNGILDVKEKEPIIIIKAKKPTIIIDTSGETTESKLDEYDKCILILKDKLFYKKSNINIDQATYDFFKWINLDKEKTRELLPKLKMGAYLIEFVTPVLMIVLNLFSAFIISLAGVIINALLRWPLKYRNIYKMSLYSITTGIILGAILRYLNISLLFTNYIYLIIGFVYVFIAFKGVVINIED